MTITEFAILVFKSPPNLSDPTLPSLFWKLSTWQSECSGFPLRFFTDADDPCQIHLVTGWTSVTAHEAWIQGERNQELLRVFAPYVDMPKIRMVHLDVDFEAVPQHTNWMVVERYHDERSRANLTSRLSDQEGSVQSTWSLLGRDVAQVEEGGDVFRFVGAVGSGESDSEGIGSALVPVERWVLKRVDLMIGAGVHRADGSNGVGR